MDRTRSADNVDIGGGRRGFQDQNAVAGIAGTRVDAAFLNSIQEEILAVIEGAGLTPDAGNWQQLLNSIKKISNDGVSRKFPLSQLNGLPWLPVISMSQTTPPSNPKPGDFYLVPLGAKAAWSGKSGHIAEWNGDNWLFSLAANGHGIGLPDGQIWQKINGDYAKLSSVVGFSVKGLKTPTLASRVASTAIIGQTVLFDSDRSYNTTTGIYTVPVDGIYIVTTNFYFEDIDSGCFLFLSVDGRTVAESSTNSRGRVLALSAVEKLQAGQSLQIRVYQASPRVMNLNPEFVSLRYPHTFGAAKIGGW